MSCVVALSIYGSRGERGGERGGEGRRGEERGGEGRERGVEEEEERRERERGGRAGREKEEQVINRSIVPQLVG